MDVGAQSRPSSIDSAHRPGPVAACANVGAPPRATQSGWCVLSQLSELAPNLALAMVGSSSWRLMEAGSGALASNAFINAPGARLLVASICLAKGETAT